MSCSLLLSQYVWWHYHAGLRALVRHASNLPRLVWRLFAPVSLLKNLFAPFQRLQESYPEQVSLKAWVSSFVVNTLMRLLGAAVRSALLLFGLIIFTLSCLFTATVIVMWVIWPLVCIGLTVFAVNLTF